MSHIVYTGNPCKRIQGSMFGCIRTTLTYRIALLICLFVYAVLVAVTTYGKV